jgi:hypothetical protein
VEWSSKKIDGCIEVTDLRLNQRSWCRAGTGLTVHDNIVVHMYRITTYMVQSSQSMIKRL